MQVRTARAMGGHDWHFSAVALHYSGLQHLGKLLFCSSLTWTIMITLTKHSSGELYEFWKTLIENGIWGSWDEKPHHNIHFHAFISSQTKDYISKRSPVNATFANGMEYYQGFSIASMPGIDN